MRLSGVLPVVGRRVMVALGVAVMMLVAASAQAQTPPAAAAPQDKPADMFKFDANVAGPVLLMIYIKPGQEAPFEEAYDAIRKGLAASSKPELQAQAKTMSILRLNMDLPAEAPRPYVVVLDPPTPNVSMIFIAWTFLTSYSPATGTPRAVRSEFPRMIELIASSFSATPVPL